MTNREMPCGNCDCGTYAAGAVLAGVEMYRGTKERKEALRISPMCKHDASHICWGARDFITACDWPMKPSEWEALERLVRE